MSTLPSYDIFFTGPSDDPRHNCVMIGFLDDTTGRPVVPMPVRSDARQPLRRLVHGAGVSEESEGRRIRDVVHVL